MPKANKTTSAPKSKTGSSAPGESPAKGSTSLQHGGVTVTIPEYLTPPAQSGKLSPAEVKRIARAPHGIGLICDQVAAILEKSGDKFDAPRSVTPATLRDKGKKAEDIDGVILDLEVLLATLRQANLIFDADAWAELRKVNDQVKAQSKADRELLVIFKPLVDYLAKSPLPAKAPPTPAK